MKLTREPELKPKEEIKYYQCMFRHEPTKNPVFISDYLYKNSEEVRVEWGDNYQIIFPAPVQNEDGSYQLTKGCGNEYT